MERRTRQYILSTINQTFMLYLIYWTLIEFTAVQTEVPNVFKVEHRELTKEIQLLSKSEAETQFAKMKALAPYIGAKSVTFDSVIICKPGPKNSIIPINGNKYYFQAGQEVQEKEPLPNLYTKSSLDTLQYFKLDKGKLVKIPTPKGAIIKE